MKSLTITNGFAQMSDGDLLARTQQIIESMSNNPNFPAPDPAITVLTDALDNYSNALNEAGEGDRVKAAIKNQKKAVVVDKLHLWSDYVLYVSKGDEVVARTSGFSIGRVPAPAPPIGKPQNITLEAGINSGELLCKVKRVKGGRGYVYQYGTDEMIAAEQWLSIPSSTTKCTLPNLAQGQKYTCRVAVFGSYGQLVYSDMLSRIVA